MGIMDIVSLISLVLAAGKVTDVCLSTGLKLRRMRNNYKDAPAILAPIEGECDTVQTAIERIKLWAKTNDSPLDEASSNSLTRWLDHCHVSVLAMERKVNQIASGVEGQAPRWEKIKLACSKEALEQCLSEMRWQANQAHFLVSTMQLWVLNPHLRPSRLTR
jgi:hypothetical protein